MKLSFARAIRATRDSSTMQTHLRRIHMRKLIVSEFMSLDGVVQAPGGPDEDTDGGFQHGGWLPQFFDEDVGQAIDRFFDLHRD